MRLNSTDQVKRGWVGRSSADTLTYRQRLAGAQAGLQWLECGEFALPPGSCSHNFAFPQRECLLAMWKGNAVVAAGENEFSLEHYDMLYLPLGCAFALRNETPEWATVLAFTAPASNPHPLLHIRFREISTREERIRHLKGKDVFLMLNATEPADKLLAGYTFFQPWQRSWPPHNHTDQEEIYFFTRGRGAMEVYESPETLSFVVEVREGDLVSIPVLNYHPVFSQQEPLEFLWCIAGARYWVGDKVPAFLQGESRAITT